MAEATAALDPVAAAASPPVDSGRRRYILILLMLAYVLSFLDRQVLSILVEPIKADLHLKDADIGILTGPVFVIFYTFLGVPIAWAADRASRPAIIAVSLALWSGFTALSGFATGFVTLGLARLGVGFGEAGCNPSSHSLIADISRPEQRASGLAFYSMGVPIGTLIGLAMGGLIADAFGWRAAFMAAAAPGLLLSLVIALTVREPRGETGAPVSLTAMLTPLKDMAEVLKALSHKRTFWLMATASGASAFVGYSELYFNASFFLRCHTAELASIAAGFGLKSKGFLGLALGAVSGLGGLTGTLIGGWVADRGAAGDRRLFGSVPAIVTLASAPLIFVIFTVKSAPLAIALLLLNNVVFTIWYGSVYSTAQSVVAPRHRA
ncbi:MAG TPA: MFS transporter, partial [Caulobacteraceae bacterium]|nr:MFS transporter [Caulobacteraceae bacterium]